MPSATDRAPIFCPGRSPGRPAATSAALPDGPGGAALARMALYVHRVRGLVLVLLAEEQFAESKGSIEDVVRDGCLVCLTPCSPQPDSCTARAHPGAREAPTAPLPCFPRPSVLPGCLGREASPDWRAADSPLLGCPPGPLPWLAPPPPHQARSALEPFPGGRLEEEGPGSIPARPVQGASWLGCSSWEWGSACSGELPPKCGAGHIARHHSSQRWGGHRIWPRGPCFRLAACCWELAFGGGRGGPRSFSCLPCVAALTQRGLFLSITAAWPR